MMLNEKRNGAIFSLPRSISVNVLLNKYFLGRQHNKAPIYDVDCSGRAGAPQSRLTEEPSEAKACSSAEFCLVLVCVVKSSYHSYMLKHGDKTF